MKQFLLVVTLFALVQIGMAQEIPTIDRRTKEVRHLDLKYEPPVYQTKEEWMARAAQLRKQILFASGLFPEPLKNPLNAQVFGKSDKGDYTVEKVFFESTPGHYVTGNLYKPAKISGKVPAVLCPHGHWAYGRLENQQLNSGQARAANFARQGYIAFSWDMVGYNDSIAVPHTFANHREGLVAENLWGVNLLGLQLWNSIRSVDFLLSLPEVDAEKLAVTGESGGATQTFLLYAVDDRIKVSAPVNMISSVMQGGSVCENAPLLRIDTNNMEIGAMMAPRPMMMIAATGDWTKDTPTVEYPAVQNIYKLLGAGDKVNFAQFDSPHNYHRESREAVYGAFAYWLQGRKEFGPLKEPSSNIPTLPELLVFYGRSRPENELNEKQLTAALIKAHQQQLNDLQKQDADKFKTQFGEALKLSIMAENPKPEDLISVTKAPSGITVISRKNRQDLVALSITRPKQKKSDSWVLIASPVSEFMSETKALTEQLLKDGHNVAFMTTFPGRSNGEDPNKFKFLTTYNRSDDANRVQDILTAVAYINKIKGTAKLNLIGVKEAGLHTILAQAIAKGADKIIADAAQFDTNNDQEFLKKMAIPGIRRAGDFRTAIGLIAPSSLTIHNAGTKFQVNSSAVQIKNEKLGDLAISESLKIKQ